MAISIRTTNFSTHLRNIHCFFCYSNNFFLFYFFGHFNFIISNILLSIRLIAIAAETKQQLYTSKMQSISPNYKKISHNGCHIAECVTQNNERRLVTRTYLLFEIRTSVLHTYVHEIYAMINVPQQSCQYWLCTHPLL